MSGAVPGGGISAQEAMNRLREAVDVVRKRSELEPRLGIVLGTGLGALAEAMEVEAEIPYPEIPHFPSPTVETHAGRLLLGLLDGVPTVAMQGRFHLYEGYSAFQVAFPVRVMKLLGAETLIVSGACGAMNPLWEAGDVVLLDDHINFLGTNPLVGENLDELGPRFPDMSEPYDRELQERAQKAALELEIPLRRGVYVAWLGPALETRAEYRMLRSLGADVVGMSTVPEVIAARHMDMKVMGLTIVTDLCLPDALEPIDVPAIIHAAKEAEPKLTALVRAVSRDL